MYISRLYTQHTYQHSYYIQSHLPYTPHHIRYSLLLDNSNSLLGIFDMCMRPCCSSSLRYTGGWKMMCTLPCLLSMTDIKSLHLSNTHQCRGNMLWLMCTAGIGQGMQCTGLPMGSKKILFHSSHRYKTHHQHQSIPDKKVSTGNTDHLPPPHEPN